MAIEGKQFDLQSVTALDDASLYQMLSDGQYGVIRGCTVTKTGLNLYVAPGYVIGAGRVSKISGTQTVTLTAISSGTLYCYLVLEYDMSQTNTTSAFNQGSLKVITHATEYPTLTQEDINDGGQTFQIPLARFQQTTDGITNLVSPVQTVDRPTSPQTIKYITVPSSGWSSYAPYSQTVTVSGITAGDYPDYTLYIPAGTAASTGAAQAEAFGCLNSMITANGSVTLYCYSDKPSVNFQLALRME